MTICPCERPIAVPAFLMRVDFDARKTVFQESYAASIAHPHWRVSHSAWTKAAFMNHKVRAAATILAGVLPKPDL